MSNDIQPFRIAATDSQLDDLKRRLRETRWPEHECVDDWSQDCRSHTRRSSPLIGWKSTTGAQGRLASTTSRNSRRRLTGLGYTLCMFARLTPARYRS